MAPVLTVTISVVLCGFMAFCSWLYVRKAFHSIDSVLDSILSRNTVPPFDTTKDNRLSKLTHKATKIVRMTAADIAQTTKDKETIQSFLSDMSHQIKTPLSSICMYTDLLREESISACERKEFLFRIKTETEKLRWMMDCLVNMSRLEVGAIELSPAPFGIKQTISDSISTIYAVAAKKNIAVSYKPFQDITLLHDRKWTIEALSNILENAVKYSNQDSEILLSVESLPIYTKISVTDHGIGIPPDEWNSIFKRFYRGQNAKQADGAGLGLYLTSLILQKQGGYLHVDSKPGYYTTFSIFLQNCEN